MDASAYIEIQKKLDLILDTIKNNGIELNNGIDKTIDNLGRITIPKIIRKQLNIEDGAEVKVYLKDNKIILEILK